MAVVVHLTPDETRILCGAAERAALQGWPIRLWIDPMDGGVKYAVAGQSWSPAYGSIELTDADRKPPNLL